MAAPKISRRRFVLIRYGGRRIGAWREVRIVVWLTNSSAEQWTLAHMSDSEGEDSPQLKEDLERVRAFAKGELFEKVKFLIKEKEDLRENGPVYRFFVRKCGRYLGREGQTPQEREMNLKYVWTKATKRKVIVNGLVARRSGVYTTMQNRFRSK